MYHEHCEYDGEPSVVSRRGAPSGGGCSNELNRTACIEERGGMMLHDAIGQQRSVERHAIEPEADLPALGLRVSAVPTSGHHNYERQRLRV